MIQWKSHPSSVTLGYFNSLSLNFLNCKMGIILTYWHDCDPDMKCQMQAASSSKCSVSNNSRTRRENSSDCSSNTAVIVAVTEISEVRRPLAKGEPWTHEQWDEFGGLSWEEVGRRKERAGMREQGKDLGHSRVKTNWETLCGGSGKGHLETKFLICFLAEFGHAVCSVGSLLVTPKCWSKFGS